MAKATISKGVKTKTTWANALKRDWQLYLLLMIPVALVVIFNYASYGGIRMVFMDYKPAKGYAGSKWVGWATFQKVFKDKDFIRALKSSIVFNLLDLAVGFPMPIILALILNELRFPRFKKVTQTILYLPHFLSWVIVGSVAYQMFRPTTGMVNVFLMNATSVFSLSVETALQELRYRFPEQSLDILHPSNIRVAQQLSDQLSSCLFLRCSFSAHFFFLHSFAFIIHCLWSLHKIWGGINRLAAEPVFLGLLTFIWLILPQFFLTIYIHHRKVPYQIHF